jgi:hypothetical protein
LSKRTNPARRREPRAVIVAWYAEVREIRADPRTKQRSPRRRAGGSSGDLTAGTHGDAGGPVEMTRG